MPFSERDWKHLRALQATALDRYCERILDESSAIIQDTTHSSHDRYLRLFSLLQERNAEMAAAFDDVRRSTAVRRLAAMLGLGVLTEQELSGFNADVRETATGLGDLFAPRGERDRRRRR